MIESDNPSGIFNKRLLSGWSRIFSNKQDNKSKTDSGKGQKHGNLKPFPPNHFFSKEELIFLSKNRAQCTLLQSWAVEKSLWAKSQSKGQDINDPQFFPPVQWQDGLMSTWIDSRATPDSIDQQADRLCRLQLEGYELESDFVRMIDARACRSLQNNLFTKETGRDGSKQFIWVKSIVDKPGMDLALSLYHYSKISHYHDSEETVPYKKFKSLIENKKIIALDKDEQHQWNEEAKVRDMAEEMFAESVSLMKKNNICQGMFPANDSIGVSSIDGKNFYPIAWSLSGETIVLDFDPNVFVDRSSRLITPSKSYQFINILTYIKEAISEQDGGRELLTFVRAFGKEFCGDKVLSSMKHPFCEIKGIRIDRVVAKASDTIVAFNNATLKTVTLSSEDRATLLKAVIVHSDMLFAKLMSDIQRTQDETVKKVLQDNIEQIYRELSVYNIDDNYQTLDELWEHITSMYGVSRKTTNVEPTSISSKKDAPSQPLPDGTGEHSGQIQKESQTIPEPVDGSVDETDMPNQSAEEQPVDQVVKSIPEGYIRLASSSKGRWHTPEMLRREAYRAYGKLLSTKLKKQLENDDNPWVSKQMMIPRDANGTFFTGSNAIMLALWMEEQGFELPFFITEDELRTKGLGILQDAESLFILTKTDVSRVYNIAQTTFPIIQKRSYESLKLNMIAAERRKTAGYQFLDSSNFYKIALKFDGTPGLSLYDNIEKVIHIAPKESFEIEDDYYRDLTVAMVESTRDVDFDTLGLDSFLFENLVSHLGSGIISQSCRFDATNPEYSQIWRERLENNPEYTKNIMEQADAASSQVLESALA